MIDLAHSVRALELEVRALKSRLQRVLVGAQLAPDAIAGIVPIGSGGTGAGSGPLSIVPRFVNDSGGALAEGAVVVLDAAGAREITITATAGNRLVIGAVHGDAAPYAAAAETPVLVLGYHPAVVVQGAVAIGDYLRTSTTTGAAASAGTDPVAGVFAIALSAAAGPGAGTVAAFLFGGSQARINEVATALGDLLVAAAAGDFDRLGVSGTDGWVLTEDSTQPLGMSWQAATSIATRIYVPMGIDLAGSVVSP